MTISLSRAKQFSSFFDSARSVERHDVARRSPAGTAPAWFATVEVSTRTSPRRWSKRALPVVVSSLILAVAALVVGIVAFARSAGFVLHGVEAAAEVGQITPDPRTAAGSSASLPSAAQPRVESSPVRAPATAVGADPSPAPGAISPLPAASTSSGGANGAAAGMAALGGATGLGGNGGTGGAPDGSSGNAGAAGASQTFWQTALQSALTVLSQTTSTMCGHNTCNVGQVCCNASCGICTAPGATCDQAPCSGAARTPTAVRCGRGQCNDGQVCCNASCGICTAPGETCSEAPCR